MSTSNPGAHIANLQAAITEAADRDRSYNSLWHTYWDQEGIDAGPFNGRMLSWINSVLVTSHTNLPEAMQAFAEDRGAYNWDSIEDLSL
jgi:hypothetical protein